MIFWNVYYCCDKLIESINGMSKKIQTDFKPKGKPSKHRKQQNQLARMITKERTTRLEGSFGKEKEHYHLKK